MDEQGNVTRAEQEREVKQLSDFLLSLTPEQFASGWSQLENWNSVVESDAPDTGMPGLGHLTGFAAEVVSLMSDHDE